MILIVEDEMLAAQRMQALVKKHITDKEVMHVDTILGATELLKSTTPDLIFLDIHLGDGLSFHLFESNLINSPVIFTTAFNQYAVKAFEVDGIDYLLKPIKENDFTRAVERWKAKLTSSSPEKSAIAAIQEFLQGKEPAVKHRDRFLVKVGDQLYSITSDKIEYFFFHDRTTYLVTNEGKKYILDDSIDKLAKEVDPDRYFRINRQYLMGKHAIEKMIVWSTSRLKIVPRVDNAEDIVVAREKTSAFKEWMSH